MDGKSGNLFVHLINIFIFSGKNSTGGYFKGAFERPLIVFHFTDFALGKQARTGATDGSTIQRERGRFFECETSGGISVGATCITHREGF